MKKLRNGFNPFQVVPDAVMLIGREYGIAVQTKAHQDTCAVELFFKKCHNRDAATTTLRDWGFAKSGFIGLFGSAVFQTVDGCDISRSAVVWFYFYFHGFWCNTFEVFLNQFCDFLPILVGN